MDGWRDERGINDLYDELKRGYLKGKMRLEHNKVR